MNGLSEVRGRIAQIEGQMASLSARPATVAGGGTASSAGSAGATALLDQPGGAGDVFAQTLAGFTSGTGAGALGGLTLGASSGVAAVSTGTTGPTGADLVKAAERYLGVPYKWGGTDPATGLDCSALVQRAMRDLGVDIPRVTTDQRKIGTAVESLAQAKPGDLLFMSGPGHVAIYVGNGRMLDAPRTGDHVRIRDVWTEPAEIRRVLPVAVNGPAPGADAASLLRPASLGASPSSPAGPATPFDALFDAATQRYGLPDGLLRSVAQAESGFDPRAVSHAGARGLMQIMPGTARELGVDPFDPAQAVDGAARLLRDHLRSFGSIELALAAYNAGPGAVRKHDGIPPYEETQNYVRKVTSLLARGVSS